MSLRITLLALTVLSTRAIGGPIAVEVILPPTAVHAEGDRNIFATQFDYQPGRVVTVHVEAPLSEKVTGANLLTVLRFGNRQGDGSWAWETTTIENRTLLDTWHTQSSVAFDNAGHIHVAYNMHNMPWQYSVSERPWSISKFLFKGDPVSQEQLNLVKFENKTPFPDVGRGAIPGNQVTYPMFFRDNVGDLYVTYRFAIRPARGWYERGFAAGIAKFDLLTRTWVALGGSIPIGPKDATLPPASAGTYTQRAIAFQDKFTAYLPTLAFDRSNHMHLLMHWRAGEAGEDTTNPTYAFSKDGFAFESLERERVNLPLTYSGGQSITNLVERKLFATSSLTTTGGGAPIAVLHPLVGGREIWTGDPTTGRFLREPSPAGASTVVVDRQGRHWAFATGLRVFMRSDVGQPWHEVGQIGTNLCFPKVRYFPEESRFVIHAKSCDGRFAQIVSFRR